MTVVGTRPEIIRLSRTILALDQHCDHVVVHTGQNWHPQLSDVFFTELGLRQPDHYLDVANQSLGSFLGGVLIAIEPVLKDERPEALLVLGDTNSSIAALLAKRKGVPVFHMEAGNRCWDENVPEEINRRMIDHICDFNLCYTEHARRNLLAEGLPARRIFVTGSPLAEVLHAYRDRIDASDILDRLRLRAGKYLLVSMHREENVDSREHLESLLTAMVNLQNELDLRTVISTHPRLQRRLADFGTDLDLSRLEFLEPFGYLDFNQLQLHAKCVLSDSGTISEESSILGFPAVTIRNAMERPEALDSGSIILTGTGAEGVERAVRLAVSQWSQGWRPTVPDEYQWLDCSSRVVRLITGLGPLRDRWMGIGGRKAEEDPKPA